MFYGSAHGEEVFVASGWGMRGRVEGRKETDGFPSYLGGMRRSWKEEKKDIPDACNGDKGFIKVGIVVDEVCSVEHSLASTMVLWLGDSSAVSVEGRKGTSEHGGRPEKRRAGERFNVVCGMEEGHP